MSIYARKHGRYGHRDATMILVAYRHGLRASEVCDLPWQQIELSEAACMFTASRTGLPACTRSAVTRCGRCASYAAITRQTPTYHADKLCLRASYCICLHLS